MKALDAYARHLGISEDRPSPESLSRLVARHAERVLFENVTKLIDYRDRATNGGGVPCLEDRVERLVGTRLGGTCIAINTALYALLVHLGYETSQVQIGNVHLASVVRFGEDLYYVDRGIGYAPMLEAIPLPRTGAVERAFGSERVRLTSIDGIRFTLERFRGDRALAEAWPFRVQPAMSADELAALRARLTSPETEMLRCFYVQSWEIAEGRGTQLLNGVLSVRRSDGRSEKRILTSQDEIVEVAAGTFGVEQTLSRQALDVLADIGVDPFDSMAAVRAARRST